MRSRPWLSVLAAGFVALAVGIAVASVAGAGSSEVLPPVTADELLAQVSRSSATRMSVSGEISWHNNLFGAIDAPAQLAQMPARSPLLAGGSGRLWASEAGVRVESQGAGGDQVAAVSAGSRLAWIWDSATNSAHRYELPGEAAAGPAPSPCATATLTPIVVGAYLKRLAPHLTVQVSGQATVAGRPAYLLRMTPAAEDTAVGMVQASIDGQTWLPLRVEVFAKGAVEPVLRFGFDSISYEPVDPALFEFTVPDGAVVETETFEQATAGGVGQGYKKGAGHGRAEADDAQRRPVLGRALLTLDEARSLVDYELAWARSYEARSFRWASVLGAGGPLTAAGEPLLRMAGVDALKASKPTSVLVYGSGFGAITLAQTRTTDEVKEQLGKLPLFEGPTTADGAAQSIFTPLGGVVIWQRGDTTLIASGMVTRADLEAFVRTVR